MIKFKKSNSISGKITGICVIDGKFADVETGEEIELSTIMEEKFGSGQPFDISASQKSDEEVE